MRPLFYILLVPGDEGNYEFAGAYESREVAEAKATELDKPYRIEAATRQDLEGTSYA
jgi:hypothetical protein